MALSMDSGAWNAHGGAGMAGAFHLRSGPNLHDAGGPGRLEPPRGVARRSTDATLDRGGGAGAGSTVAAAAAAAAAAAFGLPGRSGAVAPAGGVRDLDVAPQHVGGMDSSNATSSNGPHARDPRRLGNGGNATSTQSGSSTEVQP